MVRSVYGENHLKFSGTTITQTRKTQWTLVRLPRETKLLVLHVCGLALSSQYPSRAASKYWAAGTDGLFILHSLPYYTTFSLPTYFVVRHFGLDKCQLFDVAGAGGMFLRAFSASEPLTALRTTCQIGLMYTHQRIGYTRVYLFSLFKYGTCFTPQITYRAFSRWRQRLENSGKYLVCASVCTKGAFCKDASAYYL